MRIMLKNKIFISVSLAILLLVFSGAYFVQAGYSFSSQGGEVLGVEEEYRPREMSRNFLPENKDAEESFNFFADMPQKTGRQTRPDINSASVYVYDPQSSYTFFDKNSRQVRPIASISKLMTALVFLDNNPGWETVYKIGRGDRVEGGRIYLYLGDQVRLLDLFNLSLTASANTATKALVNSTGLSQDEFVGLMNKKAAELGMTDTAFYDPTGIDSRNVSNGKDLSVLVQKAISKDDIRNALLKKEYFFKTLDGVEKKAYSTDALLPTYPKNGVGLVGGKTGYLTSAGFCFVGLFTDSSGRDLVSVVLGADTVNGRFLETDSLVQWAFGNFVW